MTINRVLTSLTQNHCVTTAEASMLQGMSACAPFLRAATQIYEKKVRTYLDTCLPSAQRAASDKGPVLDKIMQTAWRCFLHISELSVLPLIKDVLEESSPDLAASLALSTVTPRGDVLKDTAEKVFICYAGRYRLFHTVDREALLALCQEVHAQEPAVFPLHLYNAMQVEEILSRTLKSGLQDIEEKSRPQFIDAFVLANEGLIRDCALNTLFYLGTVIKTCALSQDLLDRYFRHLQTDQKQVDFARLISEGFMGELKKSGALFDRLKKNASGLKDEKVHRICLPALSLLEIRISVDKDAWQKPVEAIKDARSTYKKEGENFEARIEEAKRMAQQDIDAWRASIPDRGFNIYGTTGTLTM